MYEPNIDYYKGEDKDQIKERLKNVTLYKLYNKLEQELKTIPNVQSCNKECGAKLKGDSSDVSKLLELCKGICNIISKAKNINGFCSEKSCSDAFIHMSIWLYERVEQITSSDSEIKNFYEVLTSIMQTKGSHLEKCSIINFNKGKNGFKDMKYLYEFLHICDNIKDEISEEQNEKNQLYCTYIKEFFRYYNTIEGNCTAVQNKPIYCTVIGKYQSTLNDTGTLDIIYNKCNFDKIPCEGDSSVKPDFPCLKMKENLFKNESQSDYKKNIFTPIGSYLRTKMRRKKNIKRNTHEEKYNNLENISSIQGNYADITRYNIMYQ